MSLPLVSRKPTFKVSAMGPKESDHDSVPAEAKETEQDKSRFTVKLVVLVNAFLFSTCFFMDNSVFPVSILNFLLSP